MCGIVGILSPNADAKSIKSMTDTLQHRGPDAKDTFISDNGQLGFGHTRLSVIDLSAAANQPMHSSDGRYTIVYNGEIYNYQDVRKEIRKADPSIVFKTNSDTETILWAFQLWREKMVERLDGMFAIAIYSHAEQALSLFRDRIGKKPLYYFDTPERFVFASEVKALKKDSVVQNNLDVNIKSIHRFLQFGFIPEPETIFTKIKKFPAGHWAVKTLGLDLQINEYWSPVQYNSSKNISSIKQIKVDLSTLLNESVQKRLISDVPVGAFLSGGTDSSLVTALAAKHHPQKLKTFSIGFKEAKYDESKYAENVARHLGTEHYAFTLSEDDALDIMEDYLNHFDEPFADTSAIPTMLVSKLAREKVKVALTGDGGDELFMGYGAYDWARRLSNPFVKLVQTPVSAALKRFGTDRLKRIGKVMEKVSQDKLASHIFSQEQYFFSDNELQSILCEPEKYEPFTYPISGVHSSAEQQTLFDLQYYLKDDLLVKVDRASMFHSLECRNPLLDHHLIEYALTIPEKYKLRNGQRKWILKELLREYLPDNLVDRPKWGFSVPLSTWLNGKLNYLIENFLNKDAIEKLGVLKYENIQLLLKKFRNGEMHLYNRVWVLIVIHKWLTRLQ